MGTGQSLLMRKLPHYEKLPSQSQVPALHRAVFAPYI